MKSPVVRLYRSRLDGGSEPPSESGYCGTLKDFWILEGERFSWMSITPHLDAFLARGSERTLVLYQPWWPGRKRRTGLFMETLGRHTEDLNGSLLARLPYGFAVGDVLQLRQSCGGDRSGLWLLAVPRAGAPLAVEIRERQQAGSPAIIASAVADHFESALALNEGAVGTLYVRRTHPAFDAFGPLLLRLNSPG